MSDPRGRMTVADGDITKLDVDAIVNAANDRLAPGGGVCGAIHRAAGLGLTAACVQIGGCPTGQARLTPGFKLKAKYVIHAVGPVWNGGKRGEDELLTSAYRASLEIAHDHGIETMRSPPSRRASTDFRLRERPGSRSISWPSTCGRTNC